jgi:dTMP kinase
MALEPRLVVECVRLSGSEMPARGKFVALEGIDGSGKRTQLQMLSRALSERGVSHVCVSFPCYDGFFGKLVARFLNGDFGRLGEVDPHFSALLYAGDRMEHKTQLEEHLIEGEMVLADRYVSSNLAHQGARMPRGKLSEFLRWLEKLEYGVYGLPREDLIIYFRLPAAKARQLVGQKGARGYTKRRRDLQEADLAHLRAAAGVYDRLAKRANWATIECLGSTGRNLRTPEMIHRDVLAAIEKRVSATHFAH